MKKAFIISFPLIIFCICLCVVLLGCCSPPPPVGYINIKNGLRLKDYTLISTDLNKTNELKIASCRGIWETNFIILRIIVSKGSLTFQMDAQSITFLPDQKVVVSLGQNKNYEFITSKSYKIPIENNRFPLWQLLDHSDQEKIIKEFKQEGRDGSEALFFNIERNEIDHFILLKIPIIRSDDFEGNCGELYVQSNWYNGPSFIR